ncbi:MAG TPA: APC family permease, partial [Xanthobacteraceae bacterium]|nr:APC family permease [Xanthobacteraceae bacterium]
MAVQAGHITQHTEEYRRDTGTVGVAFLVINGLIGAGIFAMPELLHQAVGNFAPWLLLGGACFMASVIICFAGLAGLTDRSGGPQRFATDAFGRFPGFQVGWLFYSSRMLGYAANVTVLIAYAAAFWPALGEGISRSLALIVIFGSITALNVLGMRRVVAVLGALTLFKLVPLILLIGVAILANPGMSSVNLPQFPAIQGVALSALYAFTGAENATVPAGEINNPKRALPQALLTSLAIVALIYFALQFAYSASPVAGTGSKAPLAALAGYYLGNGGSLLIAATAILSVLANSISGHTCASRMTASLSDDRLLPRWFGKVSRWGTPSNSIV